MSEEDPPPSLPPSLAYSRFKARGGYAVRRRRDEDSEGGETEVGGVDHR